MIIESDCNRETLPQNTVLEIASTKITVAESASKRGEYAHAMGVYSKPSFIRIIQDCTTHAYYQESIVNELECSISVLCVDFWIHTEAPRFDN